MGTEELKPCPFCGGDARVGIKTFDLFNNVAYVYCHKCKARTDYVEADVHISAIEKAKQMWNKRIGAEFDKAETGEIKEGRNESGFNEG